MALWHDLTQRPILQAVLVSVALDREALEALHPVDGAAQVIEHRVDNLGGRAAEALTNENVLRRLQFFTQCIEQEGLRLILSEACVDLHIVELDEAGIDVLRAFRGDLGLEGHAVERNVVDSDGKFVGRDIVVQRNLHLNFWNLNL